MSNTMYGPGRHEDDAGMKMSYEQTAEAQVSALLAIAAAVNRLAGVIENKD